MQGKRSYKQFTVKHLYGFVSYYSRVAELCLPSSSLSVQEQMLSDYNERTKICFIICIISSHLIMLSIDHWLVRCAMNWIAYLNAKLLALWNILTFCILCTHFREFPETALLRFVACLKHTSLDEKSLVECHKHQLTRHSSYLL